MYRSMTEEQYFAERLDKQIQWYSQRSKLNQIWYKRLKITEFILAAMVPVLVNFITYHWSIKIIIAIAGAAIAIISAVHGLYNFHENWIEYRYTCEALKHEKYLYLAKCGIYAEMENPLSVLVERVENIISKENMRWAQIHRSKPQIPQLTFTDKSSSTGS